MTNSQNPIPNNNAPIKKPMKIMLIIVSCLFGAIFLFKGGMALFGMLMMKWHGMPPVTVTTAKVTYSDWQPELKAVGTIRSVQGVNVTAQLSGMISSISFESGDIVKEGDLLVQQNADVEINRLKELEANQTLAKLTYERDKAQYKAQGISKQQLDTDEQNLKSITAQVAQQAATIAKLTIRAPFSGRTGISHINLGQYLNPGDSVVTLQQLDPLYVDFYLPQQNLSRLVVGQETSLTTDAYPGKIFKGKISSIDPIVDEQSRNVAVEALIPNPSNELIPGMFTNVIVKAGKMKPLLVVPQTAINFNSYGNIVYLVKEDPTQKNKKEKSYIVEQLFVQTGETRGDQIVVMRGLKAGDTIVTSGQLKLRNGSAVVINNTVQPDASASPSLPNQHGEIG